MSKAMPEKVKKNPIYSRIWNLIYEKEMNCIGLILGDIGKGKSTAAIEIASTLDPTFSIERICFSVEELLKIISEGKLKRGQALVLDEAAGSEESADSRNAMSKINKTISYFTTVSRQLGLIILYVCPLLSQLDKRLRLIGVTFVVVMKNIDRESNHAKADFYWCYLSALSSKTLMPKPRIIDEDGRVNILPYVWFKYPEDKELIKLYRKKKDCFILGNINKWYKEIVSSKEKKRKVDIPGLIEKAIPIKEKLMAKGKLNSALIQEQLDVTRDTAYTIKRFMEAKGYG